MVIHHAALLSGAFNFTAGRLGVEFFFVISGIVILTAHWQDIDDPTSFVTFLWKRFRRIYPVYWVVLLPQLVWIVTRARDQNLYQRDPWVILSSLILIHIHSIHTTVTVAWTLFHEVLFYAFFSVLLLNRRIGSVLLGLWLAASVFFFYDAATYGGIFFSPLHLLFAMGMLAAWLMRHRRIHWPVALLTFGAGVFVWTCCLANRASADDDGINLLAGFGVTMLLLGLVELERRKQLKITPSLALLGDASYSIYLVHFPFLYVVTPGAMAFSAQHHLPSLLTVTLLSVGSVALGLLFHLALERPLLRWLGGFQHPALRTA